jgi:nucleotide-binding universal stress UspA family protein
MVTLNRILFATDFSSYSGEAQAYAVYLAGRLEAELLVLHVFEPPFYSPTGVAPSMRPEVSAWIAEQEHDARQRLEKAVSEVRNQHSRTEMLFRNGFAHYEILLAAEETQASLLVLGTHGRSGLAHVLLGSVAERIVRGAKCPVLTVRPRALARPAKP